MRRLPVLLLVAVAAAACSSTAISPSAPAATAPPSFVPVATQTEPTATAAPSGTAGCPTESPMSVATYLRADPNCFGARDVTLTGWESIPSGLDSGESDYVTKPEWLVENTISPSVLVDQLPEQCGLETCDPYLNIHLDPASKLAFERDGVYVVVTGHRHDPRAQTCVRYSLESPAPAPTLAFGPADCENAFVLTSVHEVAPPAGSLAFCPTAPILTVPDARANAACFHGKTLRVIGWLDRLPAIDFDGPPIAPAWFNMPGGKLPALWTVKPAVQDFSPSCTDQSGSSVADCDWTMVFVNPASGLSLGSSPRWVILTGHFDDPIAETCHFSGGGPAGDVIPPPITARQSCRGEFVVTGVQTTTAPS